MSLYDKMRTWKHVFNDIKTLYNIESTRLAWKKKNPHNYTYPATNLAFPSFPMDKVHVGNFTYGGLMVSCYTGKEEGLFIGHFCSIATGTKFLLGGEHPYQHLSSYPFQDKFMSHPEALSKGPIILEDDVWIGENCLILSGVTIRRGTIVAAGSVVTKSSEAYSIIGGVPAKIIKYRFHPSIINKLHSIDYAALTADKIANNRELLYTDINENNVDEIVTKLSH